MLCPCCGCPCELLAAEDEAGCSRVADVPGLAVADECVLSSPVGLGTFMYDGIGAGVGFVLWYLSTCGTPAVSGFGAQSRSG